MTTKPNPVLGLLIGAVLAWVGATAVNYAGIKLNFLRAARFGNSPSDGLPWVLLILAVSALIGFVLSIRAISAGALVGAGGLLTVVGIAVFLLPLRQAFDLSKLFVVPGTNPVGYVLWDGSVMLVGAILLVLGVRRWAADARRTPQSSLNGPGYYQQLPPQYLGQQHGGQTFPAQQAPGQQDTGQQGARQQDYPPRGGSQPR